VAEWLVKHRVAFRDAHEITGELVKLAESRGVGLEDLSDDDLRGVSPHLVPEVREVLSVEGSVASRDGASGRVGMTLSNGRRPERPEPRHRWLLPLVVGVAVAVLVFVVVVAGLNGELI
jgi:hypothetical protein